MTPLAGLAVRSDWNAANDDDWADVLARMPLFAGIGRRGLRKIAHDAEFAEFSPGDTVLAISAPPDYFYVILGGVAAATAKPAAHRLTTGDYFGEISLLDGRPRSASIVAQTDLHVMRLHRRSFEDALARHPTIARRFLTELGTRVRELEQQAARRTA